MMGTLLMRVFLLDLHRSLNSFSDYTWVLITAIHNLHRMRRLVGLSQTVTTT
ncbi:hypothetical protein HID58_091505, partial [Brassica napus]